MLGRSAAGNSLNELRRARRKSATRELLRNEKRGARRDLESGNRLSSGSSNYTSSSPSRSSSRGARDTYFTDTRAYFTNPLVKKNSDEILFLSPEHETSSAAAEIVAKLAALEYLDLASESAVSLRPDSPRVKRGRNSRASSSGRTSHGFFSKQNLMEIFEKYKRIEELPKWAKGKLSKTFGKEPTKKYYGGEESSERERLLEDHEAN